MRFAEPARTPAQEAAPLRVAMFWIVLLVILGLFWSAFAPEEPPARTPRRPPTSGTTTL